jgi:hypothetical protein
LTSSREKKKAPAFISTGEQSYGVADFVGTGRQAGRGNTRGFAAFETIRILCSAWGERFCFLIVTICLNSNGECVFSAPASSVEAIEVMEASRDICSETVTSALVRSVEKDFKSVG